MKLRLLPEVFEKKGVRYTQLNKIVKEFVEGSETKSDGIVIYKCENLEYNDVYYEVFRYRIALPHPHDAEDWDMVEVYPSNESFGVWAWECANWSIVNKVLYNHFDDDIINAIIH